MRLILAALAFAVAPVVAPDALAQGHDASSCVAMDARLPDGFADWNGGAAVGTTKATAEAATLQPGKGYEAGLMKRDDVAFLVEPEKPGGSVSYSGVFAFDVAEASDYRIALGSAAWLDVIEDGKALQPASFGHGPACTTIRKIVVYSLKPGRHQLQVAGNGAETVKLLVAKQP